MPRRTRSTSAEATPPAVGRRMFLKGLAATSAAVAGATMLPDKLLSKEITEANGAPVWKKAPCNLCGVGCGLLVGIERGRAVAVKGDPESPVNRGLACVKGYHSVQALYGRDRITRAMIRRDGALVEAPMNEALDLVARKLRETAERHGKESVAVYASAQWPLPDAYVAARLFGEAIGTRNVETSARLESASASAGLRSSFGSDGSVGCYEDADHADVFVIWNSNIAETAPVLFSRMLERRRTNPTVRIINLSTRTTRTSYAADRSLLHVPQSELAIANAICHEIVSRNRARRDFIDRHVAIKRGRAGIGYALTGDVISQESMSDATWKDYVRFLSAYAPESAQAIAGVPAESIRWLASLYADPSRKVMSVWDAELNGSVRGTWMNNLLYNIHLLVGKIASPGNAALCSASRAAGDTAAAGRDAISIFRALDRGDVRFIWVQSADPMSDLPNTRRYRQAARKPDRFIVVSGAYATPTTDVADVVLPAAMWIEREGVHVNAERRAQHVERMLRPPGDASSEAWQMIEIARRLGLSAHLPWERARHVEEIYEEHRRSRAHAKNALPPLPVLRSQPGVVWPYVEGRETKWRYNAAHDVAADRARGAFDFYGHDDHRAWIWMRPYEPAAELPDREFPFWLGTGGVLEHSGTGAITRRIPALHRSAPRSYVEINRDDARQLGIRNGETVRLVSRRGSLEIEARIDYRSQPARGQVFVPSFDEALPVNELTLDACCPLSGQPDGKCAVRIERLKARDAP